MPGTASLSPLASLAAARVHRVPRSTFVTIAMRINNGRFVRSPDNPCRGDPMWARARSRFFWIQLRPRQNYEGKRVADEQYRNIKGRNVDTCAKESRVCNLRDALEVGVQ